MNKELSPGKAKLAQFIATPRGMRGTLKAFAQEELKITEQTLHNWKKDPEVLKLSNSLIRQNFVYDIPDIIEAMRREAIGGNPYAARIIIDFVEKAFPPAKTKTSEEYSKSEVKKLLATLDAKNAQPITPS
jgi:hypothetical protein